jgi:MFS family permease
MPTRPSLLPRSVLWRRSDYVRLWGAQGISAFGSQITLIALPLVAIITLQASAFEVAVLTAVEFLPFVFLGIPAGVWVDRMPRRPVLVLTDIGRGLSLLSIPLAYAAGSLTLIHLYGVALLNGAMTVFFTLAYQAYLPSLVERGHLVAANAAFEATDTAARLAGPGAAGGLVAVLSAPLAILADAASFFASGSLIFSIRHRDATATDLEAPSERRGGFWAEMRVGGRFALRDRYVRWILGMSAIVNVGFNMAWAILLVYAVRELHISAGIVGLLLSAGEVGGLLGAMTAIRLTRWLGVGPVIIGSTSLFGPALLILATAPESLPYPSLVLGWAVSSFASVLYNSTTVGLRQARVPSRLQGRVVGFNRTIIWGVSPLGALIGGGLATGVGLRFAMLAGGLIALVAIVPALLSPLRSLRDLPDPSELGEA